ncbi:MAG: RIO1 family regulatory kinase/ATPase [Candidatus Bathyarchaeia archaeon]
MKEDSAVSIRELRGEHASVICYPKPSESEFNKRLRELEKLGVTALEFSGGKKVSNLPVLGKGCVGIVLIAYRKSEKLALKIRRVDADRAKMQNEAKMLKAANSIDVGPRLVDVSRNFLLMQFIDGVLFPQWLEKHVKKSCLKTVLCDVLEQCWRLDEYGLDHGELSHAPKHLIVDGENKPFIVDFETASLNRRPSNVTSIAQFLFIRGVVAEKITHKIGVKDKKVIIDALRQYKTRRNRRNFEAVLKVCGL